MYQYRILLVMSLVWILYGIAGLLGFQNIPKTHKGRSWTKRFKRERGISWLLLGCPWLALWFFCKYPATRLGSLVLLMAVCALSSLIFSFFMERKYKALLEEN